MDPSGYNILKLYFDCLKKLFFETMNAIPTVSVMFDQIILCAKNLMLYKILFIILKHDKIFRIYFYHLITI